VARIKFRPNGCVEVTDNDGRSVVLHTDDVVNLIQDILDCIYEICWLRERLNNMFEEDRK